MSRSYTRTAGALTTPTRTQIRQSGDDPDDITCTGHQKKAKQFTAGPSTKNPGRDDPKRCKFFLWADELGKDSGDKPEPGRTLGQSPKKWTAPAAPVAPQTPKSVPPVRPDDDEIDWDKVDTDDLEREAIASTPGNSQRSQEGYRERMRAAVDEGLKRKREDEESTPKRDEEPNPFLSPGGPTSPPHPFLSPTLSSLQHISEELYRQERLVAAGEKAKEGFRKTIKGLQDKNAALEARVRELEAKLSS